MLKVWRLLFYTIGTALYPWILYKFSLSMDPQMWGPWCTPPEYTSGSSVHCMLLSVPESLHGFSSAHNVFKGHKKHHFQFYTTPQKNTAKLELWETQRPQADVCNLCRDAETLHGKVLEEWQHSYFLLEIKVNRSKPLFESCLYRMAIYYCLSQSSNINHLRGGLT